MSAEDRGWLPMGMTQGDLDDGDFAWLSDAYKAGNQSKTEGRKLPYKIHGKVNEAGWKAAWSRCHMMNASDFAGGPDAEAVEKKLMADKPAGVTVNDEPEMMNPGRAALPAIEVRNAVDTWLGADLEIRAVDGDGMTFEGYAAVFNRDSQPIPMAGGHFIERIRPGAFRKSLTERGANIRMFLNHNADNVLATTRARTLTLQEDGVGLKVRAQLPDTQAGRDLSTLIKRGDVDSMSFGFAPIKDKWSEDYGERELHEVKLFEVSPVTGWPAYNDTSAAVRHLVESLNADAEEAEAAIRTWLEKDEPLTDEQFNLLLGSLNKRRGDRGPVVDPSVARWQEQFRAI